MIVAADVSCPGRGNQSVSNLLKELARKVGCAARTPFRGALPASIIPHAI
jgi:hypothetical protein